MPSYQFLTDFSCTITKTVLSNTKYMCDMGELCKDRDENNYPDRENDPTTDKNKK